MWTFLLPACLLISDAQHAARQQALLGDPPALQSLTPAYGTDAGGTIVTLTGERLAEPLEVWFGDAEGVVLASSDTTLEVRAPASAVDGDVDVRVLTAAGEANLPAAFTYWEDATGQVAATGELVWFFTVGGYWDGTSPEDYGRSVFRFTGPLDDYHFWKNWAGALDTCTRWTEGVPDYTFEPNLSSLDAGQGTLTQTSPSSTISLEWNAGETRFTAYDLDEAQVTPGETYDLSLRGSLLLPDFDMPGVFRVPAHFEVSEPDIFSQTLPDITDDQHFTWDTSDPADVVLLQVGMLNSAGTAFEQELHCAVSDVGSFWMSPSDWTRWAPGRFVNILIGRYNGGEGVLPFNQGQIAVASSIWYYGAAVSR